MTASPSSVDDPSIAIGQLVDNGAYHDAVVTAADHFGPLIGRYCLAVLGSPPEASDACREVFVTAYSCLADYSSLLGFKIWLLRLARTTCARRLESVASPPKDFGNDRQGVADANQDDRCADGETGGGEGGNGEEKSREETALKRGLRRLRPSEREAIILRYSLSLSYDDAASALDVDVPTVQQRASRALVQLSQVLAEEGKS